MHPLHSLTEKELGNLTRVGDRLLNTQHLLTQGYRTNRLRSGFGIEFLDYREFVNGDDSRNIDWRSSARSRHPLVRRYCNEASADWSVVLDNSASMSIGNSNKWALSIQCAAAICYLLLHLGNRVSLLLFSDRLRHLVQPGRGYTHYASILQTLRQIIPVKTGGGSNLNSCIERIKRHSPVFVISDFLTHDGMMDGLSALNQRGDRIHALQLLSERDFLLPDQPVIKIRDVESGQSIISSPGNNYRDQLDNFCDTLASHCRKQLIQYSLHLDNEHWKSVLLKHLLSGKKA